jgi:ribonuclease-3
MDVLSSSLGYQFVSERLLEQALTHRSHGSPNNERFEFLGDGVLNFVIAKALFDAFPKLQEGDLSRIRANLVNQTHLCELANEIDLGRYLRLGEGEMKSGGSSRPSILADALEAVFGAVFLDGGFDSAERVINKLFEKSLKEVNSDSGKDPKTQLQEYLQARKMALPLYSIVQTSGEAHRQCFEVECHVPGLGIRTRGEGGSRRSAEQTAAREAYMIASKS